MAAHSPDAPLCCLMPNHPLTGQTENDWYFVAPLSEVTPAESKEAPPTRLGSAGLMSVGYRRSLAATSIAAVGSRLGCDWEPAIGIFYEALREAPRAWLNPSTASQRPLVLADAMLTSRREHWLSEVQVVRCGAVSGSVGEVQHRISAPPCLPGLSSRWFAQAPDNRTDRCLPDPAARPRLGLPNPTAASLLLRTTSSVDIRAA
ncbi:hypothetical protein B0J13DRAFT_296092 [Dactylonectria estremocensis]|uniref:Uncharacterized protein n=1 Tax=Dactylonectria estremocensis TaxID=1079267 RepID=A0A9P9EYW3_9HYPO|nr:hypothetical protein B0J13DRAFT_296092 [Dactylonectria estremocensis]